MSKQQFKSALQDELNKLNDQIDWKIMHRLSYACDARRHKQLTSELRRLNRDHLGLWRSLTTSALSLLL
ncbi:MAG: hypothetical protein HYV76_03040 [Candidatus Vogelbacteria bacterium]|nr:hypothetical protein [Candidatus Vogelbacteria bacterium]